MADNGGEEEIAELFTDAVLSIKVDDNLLL